MNRDRDNSPASNEGFLRQIRFGKARRRMGREEFLAKQAARFDRHFAKPDPIAIDLFAWVVMSSGLFGAYEVVAFGIAKTLKKVGNSEVAS